MNKNELRKFVNNQSIDKTRNRFEEKYLLISWLKPVKSRDLGKPILTTNYRPQAYNPEFFNN